MKINLNKNWYTTYKYASFTIRDVDPDKTYETFKKSYEDSTGKAWEKEKFMARAKGWTLFGDENGYIAVRIQNSGLYKLTGVAGSLKSIIKGLDELMALGVPVWGMVTDDIANMARKKGFKVIKGLMYYPLMLMLSKILGGALGDVNFTVNKDASLTLEYGDVGSSTKYLVGNAAYFSWLKSRMSQADTITKIKENLSSMAQFIPGADSVEKVISFIQKFI